MTAMKKEQKDKLINKMNGVRKIFEEISRESEAEMDYPFFLLYRLDFDGLMTQEISKLEKTVGLIEQDKEREALHFLDSLKGIYNGKAERALEATRGFFSGEPSEEGQRRSDRYKKLATLAHSASALIRGFEID